MFDPFGSRFRANALGNYLEFLDFASFGAVTDAIAGSFMPPGDGKEAMFKSLLVFGVAFVCRPIGGVVLGSIGDFFGRHRALQMSISLMVLPSFFIGCLPTYASIGHLSTILLVMLRMLQGIAAGGEVVGAFVHTLESAPPSSALFWGAAVKSAGNLGSATGLGFCALLRWQLTSAEFLSWGWRVPFCAGLPVGLLCIWLRWRLGQLELEASTKGLEIEEEIAAPLSARYTVVHNQLLEAAQAAISAASSGGSISSNYAAPIPSAPEIEATTPEIELTPRSSRSYHFQQLGPATRTQRALTSLPHGSRHEMHIPVPPPTAWRPRSSSEASPLDSLCLCDSKQRHTSSLLVCMGYSSLWGVGYYSVCVWNGLFLASTDLVGQSAHPAALAWRIIFVSNLCLCASLLLGGWLGDRWGACRAQTLFISCIALAAVPGYMMLCSGSLSIVILGQVLLATVIGLYGGVLPFVLCAQFEPSVRYSGVGLGYNLSHALFSSTCSIVQTFLVIKFAGASGAEPQQPISSRADLTMSDSRLRPAFYIVAMAMLALSARAWSEWGASRSAARERERSRLVYLELVSNMENSSHSTV